MNADESAIIDRIVDIRVKRQVWEFEWMARTHGFAVGVAVGVSLTWWLL